eukprot:GEZU01026545.1.p1 GENE.GEZU01026545.1~~GEZU01026545.1.p1  ORF type:complete len:1032 (+),score=419.91 GEZU01026545.1:603-3698(+)
MNKIESGPKPTVAAIGGVCLGGGLELAMSCNARVCTPDSTLGLPELKLGIIPGFGGTQRLPRLVGVQKAVQMMLLSENVKGSNAEKIGLVDAVVSRNELIDAASRIALDIAEQRRERRRTLYLNDKISVDEARFVIAQARKMAQKQNPHVPHPAACLDAILAGIEKGGEAGLRAEAECFARVALTDTAKSLVYFFFATRATAKIPGLEGVKPSRKVQRLGVVGGGLMGSGIATAALLRGIRVTLKEVNDKFLELGVNRIKDNLQSRVKKGQMNQQQFDEVMSQLIPQTTYDNFDQLDMVIEAVLEQVPLKQQIFADLEKYCSPQCILATNTSTIDIELVGEKTRAHERIIGLHFFSPAHVMPLLEIIRSPRTSPQVVIDSVAFAKQISKTPVVVGNCPGFTVNRIFFPYGESTSFLVERGVNPYHIDKVIQNFGMPMGPFRMGDMAGIDITYHAHGHMAKAFSDRAYESKLVKQLVQANRLGQKTGAGYYKYAGRDAKEDPELARFIEAARREAGNPRPVQVSDKDIVEMVFFSVINEACRVVDENMVSRPSDIDVASVMGMGFPAWRGGPMFYAETVGAKYIHDRLDAWAREFPEAKFFRPCAYLQRWAASGKTAPPAPAAAAQQQQQQRPQGGGGLVYRNSDDDIVIVSAVRTAIGKAGRGGFKDTPIEDLLTAVLKKTLENVPQVRPGDIGDIVVGNVLTKGDEGATHMRVGALLAGIPDSVPIRMVNRLCSSGLQAIADVAASIRSGYYDIGIAAGVESMSTAKMATKMDINPKAKGNPIMNSYLPMGLTSENVAARFGITREAQDEFAAASYNKAAAAIQKGLFKDEIVPVTTTVKDKDGNVKTVTVDTDEGARPTTAEQLAKLKPAFKPNGCSTAGNSSQLSDGAAAVLMMKRGTAKRLGIPIMGCLRSFAVVGVDPAIMGVGPAYAIPVALDKAGVSRSDIDIYEINEAFASQALYCVEKLQLDKSKVNPLGSGIALGHPLGCTGARMTTTLLHQMKRDKSKRLGVVSMCIGTGMGAAAVFSSE